MTGGLRNHCRDRLGRALTPNSSVEARRAYQQRKHIALMAALSELGAQRRAAARQVVA
jgi:hypothetical protein